MSEIADFLTHQYDRIEKAAKLMAKYYPPPWEVFDRGWMARIYGGEPFWEVTRLEQGAWVDNDTPGMDEIIQHVALHGPDRVLADIASKRQILDLHRVDGEDGTLDPICNVCLYTPPCETVRFLAAPFSGEPGYKQEWTV